MKRTLKSIQKKYGMLNESYAWERQEGKPLPTLADVQARYNSKSVNEQSTTDMSFPELHKKKYPNYANMNDSQLRKSLKASAQDRMNKMIQAGHSVSGGTSNGSARYTFDGVNYELSYDPKKYYPSKWINKGDKDKRMIHYMQFIAKVNVMDNM